MVVRTNIKEPTPTSFVMDEDNMMASMIRLTRNPKTAGMRVD